MGYEIKYIYHAKNAEGPGYNVEEKLEKVAKLGKGHEDVPLEKLAAVITSQLARRDIWVVDVEISEYVKRKVNFKECSDGRGIIIKNKKYSFNNAAQLVSEDLAEEVVVLTPTSTPTPAPIAHVSDLTQNANAYAPMPMVISNAPKVPKAPINPKTVLYRVIFLPEQYTQECIRMGLKLTVDRTYPVHRVIPHETGNFELQKIAITDDLGRIIEVDEKYFITSGTGLFADKELGFSEKPKDGSPRLSFENTDNFGIEDIRARKSKSDNPYMTDYDNLMEGDQMPTLRR